MEDTLRVTMVTAGSNPGDYVLILVLMEDTLRVTGYICKDADVKSLNPCFNGRYSQRER